MNRTKRSLVFSVISMLLCIAMLMGSTYAWFTDSVTSANNIIKTGTLDLKVLWTEDLTSGNWKDAENSADGPVFAYENWEPGYTAIRYIKIVNDGSLAFKYALNVICDGDAGILGDVIDVYYVEDASANITTLDGLTKAGVLNDVISGKVNAGGVLLPEGETKTGFYTEEIVIAIALHMQESAGNEYQDKSVGGSFAIQLMATQYDYEGDDLGGGYDQGAQWPNDVVISGNSASADVTPVDNKVPSALDLVSEDGKISGNIPAGVAVVPGTDKMTLTVGDVSKSEANITLDENEAALSIDVHVSGVAEGNTVPVAVTVKELLPVGLNMGNYRFYHVEDGQTVEMVLLEDGATPVHNNYEYDPATGDVVLYLASFSEVALVADTENAWNGTVANALAGGEGTKADPYIIANADQFVYFGDLISNNNETYGSAYYKLTADINLGGEENANEGIIFYPIGYHAKGGTIATLADDDAPVFDYQEEDPDYARSNGASAVAEGDAAAWYTYGGSFKGTFDGNGNTISNIYQNTWQMKGNYDGNYWNAAMGLFGYVYGGTVKNLTVDSFSSDGEFTPTGVIAAYASNATFENIAITNCNPRVYNTGNGGIVGIGGNSSDPDTYKLTFTNITIDNTNIISSLWGSWDTACGGLVGMFRGAGHVYMTNCHVAAQIDVYNDVCGNYQYYWYRYSGMMVGTNKNMTTDANGYTVPETDKFHAENCTVHFGEWNDYYYCELVANSLASYTHDHQFSRLTVIDTLDEIKSGDTWIKAGNFLLISGDTKTCYHIVNKNGTLTQHLHTDAGEETVNGETVLKEDKQIVFLPFNQLFTGYGWGVKHIPVYNGEDYAFEGITILDREVADSVEKFETKFTGDFLYRVGNENAVTLGSLFAAKDGQEINDSGVWVTIQKVDENSNVSGKFTADTSDWTKGTIQFSGTGVVKVTIQDYNFCTPTVLYLEIVDAVNATGATSATANNVVLLNDITSGFAVSGEYTVFGNGFTVIYTGDGQYRNNGLRQGVVNVTENGRLDNLRIKASIYPASYLYYDEVKSGPSTVDGDITRYHYQFSAVVAKDNATISNCYIYGGRTNIFVDAGNVTITDTVTECGTLANIQIQSTGAYTVTLNNVTTIQHRVNATIGDTTQVMMGAGVIVGPDTETNPEIVLNGEFKQYNWVTAEDKAAITNSTAQTIIQTALDATAFNHTVKDKVSSNLGIIYLNNADATVKNNTGLPYAFGDVSMMNQDGKVYSLQNAIESQIYSEYTNADRSTVNGDYMPTFEFDLGDQEISYDGSEDTRYLYGDKNGITALYKDGEAALTLDLTKLATVYKYEGITYAVTAVCKDSSGNTLTATNGVVTLSALGDYTLEFTVDDNIFYNNKGETITRSVTRTYTVPLNLTVKAADIKNAEVSITKTALDGVYTTVNLTDYKLRINFLDCISVTDYDNTGTGTTVDLTSNISEATLTPSSVNVFTTASTITVTYTDGRELTVNLSKISGSSAGTKTATINTSDGVYFITEGALDNKPTESSNQNICTITSVSYKGNNGSTVTNDTDVTVTWAIKSSNAGAGCVTPDTLITLADGTQVRVDSLTGSEELLVWNMETGMLDKAPILFVDSDAEAAYEIIKLYFSDGTEVKVISEHGFWDYDLNKYVYLDENAADYIGHTFAKQNGDKLEKVELVDVVIETEVTTAWSPVTEGHLCYFVNGMLSMPGGVGGLFNIFEVDAETMTYDLEAMQKDIETYGLYTYEELNAICPLSEEMFNAAGGAYLKISIGKGNLTEDELFNMINRYSKFFD